MPQVTVVGLGLMGGSLGLALRRKGWKVTGWARRAQVLRRARRMGAVQEAHGNLGQALAGADMVVLCVPVDRIVPLARRCRALAPAGALITDVGSVKGEIVAALDDGKNPAFVGAHPMAGSEKTGIEHARADLYKGSTCVITPGTKTRRLDLARTVRFWESVGARTLVLTPAEHDRAVALVSHLPHLMAEALALAGQRWARSPRERAVLQRLAAGSFRDATRVAEADPALWRPIFEMNRTSVQRATSFFNATLRRLVARRWPLSELNAARNAGLYFRKG